MKGKELDTSKPLIILGVVVVLFFLGTAIFNFFSKTDQDKYEAVLLRLENAAIEYGTNNMDLIESDDNYISITELMNLGYLESDLEVENIIFNPLNGLYFSGNMYIGMGANGNLISYYTEDSVQMLELDAILFEAKNITSKSFLLEVNADAKYYSFSLDNGDYTEKSESNTYFFDDLSIGSHLVKVEMETEDGEIFYDKTNVVTLGIDKPTYEKEGNKVIINYPINEGNYKYEYTTDGKNWVTTEENVTVESDYVEARVSDGYNYVTGNTYSSKKEIINYQVVFDIGGGNSNYSYQTIEEGKKVSKVKDPTRKGYEFLGWYVNEKEYDFSAKVNNNLVIKAKWSPLKYTIKFNSNGGDKVSKQTVLYGHKVNKPQNITKEGYIFEGWYNNGVLYDFNSRVIQNITLEAKFKKEEDIKYYNVTFNLDNSVFNKKVIAVNNKVLKPSNPIKKGYEFIGWYEGNNLYNFNTKVSKDISLDAHFNKIKVVEKYIVSFDINGGSGVVDSQSISVDDKVLEPVNSKRSGYKFIGWYKGDKAYDFNSKVNSNFTLTAHWEEIEPEVEPYSGDDMTVINVPIDSRPVTTSRFERLAKAAGYDYLEVNKGLDSMNESGTWYEGNVLKIQNELENYVKASNDNSVVIVNLSSYLFGGLIGTRNPSNYSDLNDKVIPGLSKLRTLIESNPKKEFYINFQIPRSLIETRTSYKYNPYNKSSVYGNYSSDFEVWSYICYMYLNTGSTSNVPNKYMNFYWNFAQFDSKGNITNKDLKDYINMFENVKYILLGDFNSSVASLSKKNNVEVIIGIDDINVPYVLENDSNNSWMPKNNKGEFIKYSGGQYVYDEFLKAKALGKIKVGDATFIDEVNHMILAKEICKSNNTKVNMDTTYSSGMASYVGNYDMFSVSDIVNKYNSFVNKDISSNNRYNIYGYFTKDGASNSFVDSIINKNNEKVMVMSIGDKKSFQERLTNFNMYNIPAYGGWNTTGNAYGLLLAQILTYYDLENDINKCIETGTCSETNIISELENRLNYYDQSRLETVLNDSLYQIKRVNYSYMAKNLLKESDYNTYLNNFKNTNFKIGKYSYSYNSVYVDCNNPWNRSFDIEFNEINIK